MVSCEGGQCIEFALWSAKLPRREGAYCYFCQRRFALTDRTEDTSEENGTYIFFEPDNTLFENYSFPLWICGNDVAQLYLPSIRIGYHL